MNIVRLFGIEAKSQPPQRQFHFRSPAELRFLVFTVIRKRGGVERQLLISIPNMPELKPKSSCSVHVVKTYVMIIAIRSLDGDVKLDGPLGAF